MIQNALQEASELEKGDFPQEAEAYLDTFRAELSWLNGADEDVLKYVESALKGIPNLAQLIRYRMISLRWAAKIRLGKTYDLDDDLHLLLRKFPVVLRSLNLQIPVHTTLGQTVKSSFEDYTESFFDALDASPRFKIDSKSKLKLIFSQTATQLQACLTNNTGYRYGCVSEYLDLEDAKKQREQKKQQKQKHRAQEVEESSDPKEEEELDPNPLHRLVDRMHLIFFSPKVELSQAELDTLDGNTHQLNADDAVEVLFE